MYVARFLLTYILYTVAMLLDVHAGSGGSRGVARGAVAPPPLPAISENTKE